MKDKGESSRVGKIPEPLNILEGEARFRTLKEACDLAQQLAVHCPDYQSAVTGLIELMYNAIEHGNLGINYEEKSLLSRENRLDEEIERRLTSPEYAGRMATIRWEQTATDIFFTIEDQGEGFDSAPYMEMSPDRVLHQHGRGIVMARHSCFSQLQYLGRGNRVRATISLLDDKKG
ncbi:MAG: ATP-binding protein [Magnetococcales bacterium]|nr:ATP-binding protein [Magnetococcales bacterium]